MDGSVSDRILHGRRAEMNELDLALDRAVAGRLAVVLCVRFGPLALEHSASGMVAGQSINSPTLIGNWRLPMRRFQCGKKV